jgi:hypothetical protein
MRIINNNDNFYYNNFKLKLNHKVEVKENYKRVVAAKSVR